MGVENGGYQPSEEEIKRAESIMTDRQEKTSNMREHLTNELKGLTSEEINQILKLEVIDGTTGTDEKGSYKVKEGFKGELNGKKVVLAVKLYEGANSYSYSCKADDQESQDPGTVQKLVDLYKDARKSVDFENEMGDLAAADFKARQVIIDLPGVKGITQGQ